MQLSQLEILDQIRALISTPETWCRGAAARSARGKPVYPTSDLAVRWCVEGACYRIGQSSPMWLRIEAKAGEQHSLSPSEVNDSLGHAAVLELLESVRADLEAEARNG